MRTVQFYSQELGVLTKQQAHMDLIMAALSDASGQMEAQNYEASSASLYIASELLKELATMRKEKGD